MARLWKYLTDSRVLAAIGLAALAAILVIGAGLLGLGIVWAAIGALALLAGWGIWWMLRRAWRARRARKLAGAIAGAGATDDDGKDEVAVLRKNLLEAVGTIKTSKLGLTRGAAALYELPWYMIIGNPAAGKSSAIVHSGLSFPIPGNKALQGVGGTRNCDWFFTTDGILLDTAGRYSVQDDDRAEWFGFLDLLKRYRQRAPINGILIAVSVAELMAGPATASHELAKNLRTRVQELTERLGVHAPVYVVFTKADLVAGFLDFFHDSEQAERERIVTERFDLPPPSQRERDRSHRPKGADEKRADPDRAAGRLFELLGPGQHGRRKGRLGGRIDRANGRRRRGILGGHFDHRRRLADFQLGLDRRRGVQITFREGLSDLLRGGDFP